MKFVYFDLGNVLINFCADRACDQLADLFAASGQDVRAALYDSGLQNEYETGTVSTEDVCRRLNAHFGTKVNPFEITRAASDIFWLNLDTIQVARELFDRGIPLGILSNTCSAHWEFVCDKLFREPLSCFRELVLSYEVRSMKPNRSIYERAIERAGVAADEILFTDDRLDNVDGAVAAGMRAAPFTSAADLRRCLVELGLLESNEQGL